MAEEQVDCGDDNGDSNQTDFNQKPEPELLDLFRLLEVVALLTVAVQLEQQAEVEDFEENKRLLHTLVSASEVFGLLFVNTQFESAKSAKNQMHEISEIVYMPHMPTEPFTVTNLILTEPITVTTRLIGSKHFIHNRLLVPKNRIMKENGNK